MASFKLSALNAVTSTDDASLILVADTSDSGSTFASKKITKAHLLAGQATEAYVSTQISNLIDGAPGVLDTLNELAAAIGDDGSYATTVTNAIAAVQTDVNANETASDAAFTAATAARAAISALITEIDGNANDLITLTGIAENTAHLGTFSGSTISDSATIKAALQDLETAAESAAAGSAVADQVKTSTDATDATRYLTFVGDDNAHATTEAVYTDAGVTYNPSTNLMTVGELSATTLDIGGTNITATAAELNILDGVTSTATEINLLDGLTCSTAEIEKLCGMTASRAELNILDGVTSTTAELNILDGVTSTAAELNLLDGVTATTTELNYVDGVTSAIQTQIDTKCATGANVNTLVASTSAQTAPATYYFLVVDQSDGSIKVIDKSFLELD